MSVKKVPTLFLLVNFIFTLHYTLTAYIHSSFLEHFIPLSRIGLLFSIAALCGLIVLSYLEWFLVHYGERKVILGLLAVNSAALLVLSWHGATPFIFTIFAITAFISHYSTSLFILRTVFDIYFEEKSTDASTGLYRGELLTAANIAWVISPLIVSQLLFAGDFWKLYTISLCASLFLLLLLYLRVSKRSIRVKPIYFIETIQNAWQQKKIFLITSANFLMHFYFSWMVIYLSPYLHETIGFSWENVGLILAIMLVPYVLIDIPLGKFIDGRGERFFLIGGFGIAALCTIPLGIISSRGFLLWAGILFATRVGTAIVELATDTYFFRHVEATDGNLISFYRYAQPLAYIAGPLCASIVLFLGATEKTLWIILAGIMALGISITLLLPRHHKR